MPKPLWKIIRLLPQLALINYYTQTHTKYRTRWTLSRCAGQTLNWRPHRPTSSQSRTSAASTVWPSRMPARSLVYELDSNSNANSAQRSPATCCQLACSFSSPTLRSGYRAVYLPPPAKWAIRWPTRWPAQRRCSVVIWSRYAFSCSSTHYRRSTGKRRSTRVRYRQTSKRTERHRLPCGILSI